MAYTSGRVRHFGTAAVVLAAMIIAASGCRSRQDFQGHIGDSCETGRDCRFELECQEQTDTCQNPSEGEIDGLGSDCATNNDCSGDLLCQPETSTCQVISDGDGIIGPTLLAGACVEDAECDQGLVCQFASGTCQPPGGEDLEGIGASCITNGDCPGGLICQGASSTCQVAPPGDEE